MMNLSILLSKGIILTYMSSMKLFYFMTFDRQIISFYLFKDKEQDKQSINYSICYKNIAPEVKTKTQYI